MVIHPEVVVTPDLPTIKFREPRDQVDLDVELPRILHAQGWGCGTYFHVQFLSYDRTKLLASANFVVSEEVEKLYTSEANPYQPITKTVFSRKAEIIGNWWTCSLEGETVNVVADGSKPVVKWNPGLKVHQVKLGDKVIYSSKDKDEALKVAAG